MDPFSVLGLAANVAQFIDFMLHILEIGNQFRRFGCTEEQLSLEAAASQIESESQRLAKEQIERDAFILELKRQSDFKTRPLEKRVEALDKRLTVLDDIQREVLLSRRKAELANKNRSSDEVLNAINKNIVALSGIRGLVSWRFKEKNQLKEELEELQNQDEFDVEQYEKELVEERSTIASRVTLLKEELERGLKTGEQDKFLTKIFVQCNEVAKKLTTKLRNSKRTHLSTSESIAEAIKSRFKSSEINALVSQLDGYRKAIDSYVAEDTRNLVQAAIQRLDKMSEQSILHHQEVVSLVKVQQETVDRLEGSQDILVRGLDGLSGKQLTSFLNLINIFLDQLRTNEVITSLPSDLIKDYAILNTTTAQNKRLAEDQVFRALKFRTMVLREYSIHVAHAKAFRWLLHRSDNVTGWDSLPSWLTSETEYGCYWVGAKAGSGKSTLLKYLAKSDEVVQLLRDWSKVNTLVIASHYFWMAGDEMQKNQGGLLRSLLHSILEVRRDLIPTALPDLFDEVLQRITSGHGPTDHDIENSYATFELAELKIAFAKICKLDNKQVRICLIVDGLDEYVGDQYELVRFFQKITSGPSIIKALVSSRPEPVFCSAFKKAPKLPLENFTRGDMTLYIEGSLREHPNFKRMIEREPDEVQALCQAIVSKASGVFLWVKVVVQSVLQGLSDGNYLQELIELVDRCPDELHDMFSHMFARMKPEHRAQASKYFQWVFRCIEVESQPPSALRMSFMDTYKPSSIVEAPIFSISMDEALHRTCDIEMRIRSRCCDLLEVHNHDVDGTLDPWAMVTLTHRSVLDHWHDDRSHQHRTMLESETRAVGFDPTEGLLSSLIFHLQQRYIHDQYSYDRSMLVKLLDQFLQYIATAGPLGEELQRQYLQELDRTLSWRWQNDRWYTLHKISWSHLYLRQKAPDWELQAGTSYVLAFAVYANLTAFIEQWFESCSREQLVTQVTSILRNLVRDIVFNTEMSGKYLNIFKLLTNTELFPTDNDDDDANVSNVQNGLWQPLVEFLARSTTKWKYDQSTAWVGMVSLFIESGADLDHTYPGHSHRSAREIFRRQFGTLDSDAREVADVDMIALRSLLEQVGEPTENDQQARQARQLWRKNKRLAARQRKTAASNGKCDSQTESLVEANVSKSPMSCAKCTAVEHLREIGFSIESIYAGLDHASVGNNVSAIANWILLHQNDHTFLHDYQDTHGKILYNSAPSLQDLRRPIQSSKQSMDTGDKLKQQRLRGRPQYAAAWTEAVSKQTQLARNIKRESVVGLDVPDPVSPATSTSAKNKRREISRAKRRQEQRGAVGSTTSLAQSFRSSSPGLSLSVSKPGVRSTNGCSSIASEPTPTTTNFQAQGTVLAQLLVVYFLFSLLFFLIFYWCLET